MIVLDAIVGVGAVKLHHWREVKMVEPGTIVNQAGKTSVTVSDHVVASVQVLSTSRVYETISPLNATNHVCVLLITRLGAHHTMETTDQLLFVSEKYSVAESHD